MLDKKIIEEVKGMTREEKKAYFEKNKKALLNIADLDVVNGGGKGGKAPEVENPNSEEMAPDFGPWYTSFGYICDGERCC